MTLRHSQANKVAVKLTEFSKTFKRGCYENTIFSQKREMLQGLSVKVKAWPGKYISTSYIDTELTSESYIGRTEKLYQEAAEDLERKHPNITFLDMIYHSKRLP